MNQKSKHSSMKSKVQQPETIHEDVSSSESVLSEPVSTAVEEAAPVEPSVTEAEELVITPEPPKAPEVVAPIAPVAPTVTIKVETPKPTAIKTPASLESSFAWLNTYASKMAPGKLITEQEGVSLQTQLLRILVNILNNCDGEHCTDILDRLNSFFVDNYDKCFKDTHSNRFLESTTLNTSQLNSFTNLIYMLRNLSNKATRHILSNQIDLGKALSSVTSEEAKSKIINYYKK